MHVFIKIWIPAKAPATNVVRLESRILITYYHGRIGARIQLEVPEEPQSPHTHTQTVAALKYTSYALAGIVNMSNCQSIIKNDIEEVWDRFV